MKRIIAGFVCPLDLLVNRTNSPHRSIATSDGTPRGGLFPSSQLADAQRPKASGRRPQVAGRRSQEELRYADTAALFPPPQTRP